MRICAILFDACAFLYMYHYLSIFLIWSAGSEWRKESINVCEDSASAPAPLFATFVFGDSGYSSGFGNGEKGLKVSDLRFRV